MRRAIQSAAVRVAVEAGLEAVTVDAISEAADISERTFFNYFRSKDEVFRYPVPPWPLEQFRVAVRDRPQGESTFAALWAVLVEFAADLEEERSDVALWRELARRYPDRFPPGQRGSDPRVSQVLTEVVAERGGPGRVDDLAAAVIAGAACAAFDAAARSWTSAGGETSLVELVDAAFERLARIGAV
jgi:AcrR family transcriptional regulator